MFCELAKKHGLDIIDYMQEVIDSNLAEEKRMLKNGVGIPQIPCASLLQFSDEVIENMKEEELTANLKTIGFPHTAYRVAHIY